MQGRVKEAKNLAKMQKILQIPTLPIFWGSIITLMGFSINLDYAPSYSGDLDDLTPQCLLTASPMIAVIPHPPQT